MAICSALNRREPNVFSEFDAIVLSFKEFKKLFCVLKLNGFVEYSKLFCVNIY